MDKTSKEHKNKINREWRARNKEQLKERRAKNLNGRYKDLRARAARNKRKFRISEKTYTKMIQDGCYYCSKSLMEETGGSLDRINNDNRNYTTRNTVACCKDCNYVKSKVLTKDETLVTMEVVKQFRNGAGWTKELLGLILEDRAAKRKKQTGG